VANAKGLGAVVVFMTVLGCGGVTEQVEDDQHPAVDRQAEPVQAEPVQAEPVQAEPVQDEPVSARQEVHLAREGAEPIVVRVQVADDDFDRARGLMFRRHLGPDEGMLFVYEEPMRLTFWMENTFIPLDVLFIDEELRIIGIVTDTVPLSHDPIEVDQPSQYILEVNAGFARAHGIEPGGQIELIGVSLPGEAP